MNRTTTIFLSLSIAATLISLVGCESKQIEGQVNDPFGKPLANANIQVELTQFAAASDADGRFTLDFAPGQFTVKISKTGYTSQIIPLSVQQKTKVPLQPAMLYPIPETAGIFLLTENGLQMVSDDCKVSYAQYPIQEGGSSVFERKSVITYSVTSQNGLRSNLPVGELTFIDRVSDIVVPVKLRMNSETEGGVALQYTRSFFDEIVDKYNGFLKEKKETVGQEQLHIRTITTESNGRYVWLPVVEHGFGDRKWVIDKNKPCFYFAAGAQTKDEQTQTHTLEPAVFQAPNPSSQVPHQELKVQTEDQQTNWKPSFDCVKAATNSERMICSNKELAAADVKMAEVYKTVFHKSPTKNMLTALKHEQNNWRKNVRDVCADAACMLRAYQNRISQLSRY